MNKKGVTFLELILVLVIIAIGASLAVPKLRKSVENREAKAVLETLRSISHAVRMYEVTKGEIASDFDLRDLETSEFGTQYLNPSEYAFSPPYEYTIQPYDITAENAQTGRRIILTMCQTVKGKDGAVTDSAGFLNKPAELPC